ncbi:MAG: ABC transporter permease [Lentisphaerae bacterium]|nr:ABC transporter permease [Lentisphaerota bacterium]
MKQIVFTGFDALSLILLVGVLAGISVVTQAQLWLGKFGQIEMLGPLLVAVIVREAGPLLVNFAVIGRSGTAIAAELASMRVRGEIDLLDAQGVDPMVYLVMPRVLSIAISVLSLTVVFVVASFGSGYLFGLPIGVSAGDPSVFVRTVLQAVTTKDIANLLAKTIIPGLVSGAICCVEGLSAHGSATEIPQATARAVVRSIASVLFVSALISVLTYA